LIFCYQIFNQNDKTNLLKMRKLSTKNFNTASISDAPQFTNGNIQKSHNNVSITRGRTVYRLQTELDMEKRCFYEKIRHPVCVLKYFLWS